MRAIGEGRRAVRTRRFVVTFPLLALFGALGPGMARAEIPERPPAQTEATSRTTAFMRGMVVSCPRYGQIWGSSEMSESLVELDLLGVDWIAIHPYAGVRKNGEIRWQPASETGYLDRAVQLVRASGQSLFWKPHLAYWGNFSWRGDIEFGSDTEAWERFFAAYEAFIVDQARFAEAAAAPLLAVGVELERTTMHEKAWRRIISAVRRVYSGRLTYAANWDSLDRIPFWDALDLIGVHAYYPLSEASDPAPEDILAAWDRHLEELHRLADRHRKPVVLAEIGYPRSLAAALRPWEPDLDESPEALNLRHRLMEVALTRLESEPWLEGMFWWKWMPGPAPWDRDFSMKDPEARRLLATYWGPPDPAPARPSVPTGR